MKLALSSLLGGAVFSVALGGCNSGGERPFLEAPDTGGTGGVASSGGSGGSGAAALGGGAGAPGAILSLPFAVDDHFVATGYMAPEAFYQPGRSPLELIVKNPNDCLDRPEGAQGECHCFDYTGMDDPNGWGGLAWLSDHQNWGEFPGVRVEGGAHRVTFHAASDPPGIPVQFFVGVESTDTYGDTLLRSLLPDLGGTLERYTIDLTAGEYEAGVVGGFGWIVNSGEPARLYIDDIRWE